MARERIAPQLAPTPLRALPAGAWFTRLLDYLPNAYIHSRASDLARLRADGATPAEAATYARAYLLAPHIYSPSEHGPAPSHAMPAEWAAIPRALLDDLGLLD